MQNQHKKKIKGKLKYHFQSLKKKKQKKQKLDFFFFAKSTFFPSFLQLIERNESKMQLHDYKTT